MQDWENKQFRQDMAFLAAVMVIVLVALAIGEVTGISGGAVG